MHWKGLKYILVIVVLLGLCSWQSQRLAMLRRAGLPQAYSGYTADSSPLITFVMAGLGGFRGIVSEVFWFRVNRLQEEWRYLELVQLADWLTMLDPHATEAWIYNAWNLAYNVSVMMIRDEDRLRWVRHGIVLLRDEALRFNPRDARLYRELAWFYQNKIGDSLDSSHLAYKFDLVSSLAPCVKADGTVVVNDDTRAALAKMRLEVERMVALEARFGPLDWRVATTHALYWAMQGLDCATGYEQYMCRRAVYQALISSVFNGRFVGNLAQSKWQTAGNTALVLTTADFIEETYRLFPAQNMHAIYVRYLCAAIYRLHAEVHADVIDALYQRLLSALPPEVEKPGLQQVMDGWGVGT